MNNLLKVCLGFIFCCYCPLSYAGASKSQISSFEALQTIVEKMGSPSSTLVVMDDDDTLTMMPCSSEADSSHCQYLGGPAWYSWQSDLVKSGNKSDYRVADSQGELLDIAALILAMNKMTYTQDALSGVLQRLSNQGVRLLVETARGGSNVSATEMQFEHLQVAGSSDLSFLDLIQNNSLMMETNNNASLPSPFIPCDIPGSREVTYQRGVMYVAGQNKGVMLECLLDYYKQEDIGNTALPIHNIVFIDDTQQNVDDVYQAFKHNPNYKVAALHFDALDSHKQALTQQNEMGQRLRDTAKQRWQAIQLTLSTQLISAAIPQSK